MYAYVDTLEVLLDGLCHVVHLVDVLVAEVQFGAS